MVFSKHKEDGRKNDDNNNSEYQVASYRVSARAKSKLMRTAAQTVGVDDQPEPTPKPKTEQSEAKSGKPAMEAKSKPKMTAPVAAEAANKSYHQNRDYRDDTRRISNRILSESNDSISESNHSFSESSSEDIDMENWAKVSPGAKIQSLRSKSNLAVPKDKYSLRSVVSATTWDYWSLPPGNSLSGKVVPRLLNKHKQRRKCSVEIHRVTTLAPVAEGSKTIGLSKQQQPSEQEYSYEECFVRILVPATRQLKRKVKQIALKNLANARDSAALFTSMHPIRVERQIEPSSFDDDDDDNETVNSDLKSSSGAAHLKDVGGRKFEGWSPRYCIPICGIDPRALNKKNVNIFVDYKTIKQERDMIFDTADDAERFWDHIESQKRDEEKRQDERLNYALGGEITIHNFESITFLFEIVSAYNLPIGDITSSDPYVQVYLGPQIVHQTEYRPNTLNPIWTLKTGSLFPLTVESRQFFIEQGLKFVVKDYDQVGKDDTLGVCRVGPKILYKANGERMEFRLTCPRFLSKKKKNRERKNNGTLVIRCRRATQYDQKFMDDFQKQESKNATGIASYNAPETDTSLFKTISTKVKKRDAGGNYVYKTRPFPDPRQSLEKTEWMTKDDIEKTVPEPSHQWVEMGEGTLGKIYLEILECEKLPNLDSGSIYGNKTDAFVSVVYEDTYGMTDVINDCLSPRWLPWSNRAFILNIAYPSSMLNLGIFDFDAGPNLFKHDLIGRVSVDLTNLRSSTEYVLSYEICRSARVSYRRKADGKIKIRLRIEIPDERSLALAALYPPPPIYLNTKNPKEFLVIRKTVFGSVEEKDCNLKTFKSFIDEICELQVALYYLRDGLMSLLLWRGQSKWRIPLVGIEVDLPLHSFILFLKIIFVVEYPTLIPSFFFGSIAWLILSINGWRQGAENVWWRCHSYNQIFKMITLGDDYVKPHNIQPFENYEKAQQESEEQIKLIEDSQINVTLAEAKAMQHERAKELAEIAEMGGSDKLSTKLTTKWNMASYGGAGYALYPIQLMLSIVMRGVRIAKNILMWQEAYLSFWITTCSLVLAILSLFVPWLWCLKWASRIFVWTIFGPWMKLLDIYYFGPIESETEDQRKRRKLAKLLAQELTHSESLMKARIDRENTMKHKAMKKYMFGKYSIRVPILKQDRYSDIPLASSSATPYREKEITLAELAMQEAGYNKKRIPGQTLIGDMIPYVQEDGFTMAPTGKVALHMEKLSRDTPGFKGVTKPSKILMTVFLAIGVSYFGTPLVVRVLVESNHYITAVVPLAHSVQQ